MKLTGISSTEVIGYGFTAAVTYSCVRHLVGGGLKRDYDVFKGRTKADWAQIVIGDLIACSFLVSMAALSPHFPHWKLWRFDVIHFSWLDILDSSGQKSNLMLSGASVPYFGVFFIVILFLNLPRLAAAEEETFRLGTKDWRDAIPRSLKFGLMHMVVGVPLWCGLALAVPGLWFTQQYFKGGVSRSTMAHTLYNMALATAILVFLVLSLLGY